MHSRLQYFLQKHNCGIRSFTLWNPDYPKIPLQFLIALDDQELRILLPGVCLTNIWLPILLLQCESCTFNHPMHNLKTTRSMKRETQQLSLFSFWFYESKFSPNTNLFSPLCHTKPTSMQKWHIHSKWKSVSFSIKQWNLPHTAAITHWISAHWSAFCTLKQSLKLIILRLTASGARKGSSHLVVSDRGAPPHICCSGNAHAVATLWNMYCHYEGETLHISLVAIVGILHCLLPVSQHFSCSRIT
jgi:hypothetical protein